MAGKYFAVMLAFTLLLAACTGPLSIPTSEVPRNPPIPLSTPEPSKSDASTAYPLPQVTFPKVTPMTSPEPGSPTQVSSVITLSDFAPQPGDRYMHRGQVTLDLENSQILSATSESAEVKAILSGSLPSSCHFLRASISQPDASNTINLDVYALEVPDRICATKPAPFSASILIGSYPSGQYTVVVNGEKLGEFGSSIAPQAGDENLNREEALVDLASSRLEITSTQPVQASVLLRGNLPDPCHQLRVVITQADKSSAINLVVYSVADPNTLCITVLKPFEATIPLGSFSSGHYSVYVNGELLGEFDG